MESRVGNTSIPPTIPSMRVFTKVTPLCPVFGRCGGCAYQDISYPDEIELKGQELKDLLGRRLGLGEEVFEPLVPSPEPYHYRSRLDLALVRTRSGDGFMGFMPEGRYRVVPIEACAIAQAEISTFLPELRRRALERLPRHYRTANLVVKSSAEGRVLWGGIGRGSLKLEEKDYLWAVIRGKKIFYSLDTFFQANLSILPKVIEAMERLVRWEGRVIFYDLYAGVGLFGVFLAARAERVIMIEENSRAARLAAYNARYHHLSNVDILTGRVEDLFRDALDSAPRVQRVALVDPPRAGLKPQALSLVGGAGEVHEILYLSCNPESLLRDLEALGKMGWRVEKVVPFDFFPKTKHIEMLCHLRRKDRVEGIDEDHFSYAG